MTLIINVAYIPRICSRQSESIQLTDFTLLFSFTTRNDQNHVNQISVITPEVMMKMMSDPTMLKIIDKISRNQHISLEIAFENKTWPQLFTLYFVMTWTQIFALCASCFIVCWCFTTHWCVIFMYDKSETTWIKYFYLTFDFTSPPFLEVCEWV